MRAIGLRRAVVSGERADGLPAVLSDPARLAALEATGLVGTGPEQVFDDLTQLAKSVTGCDISAITFVGESRTYWKSVPHLSYGGVEQWQNGVGDSFCYFAVAANAPFVVEDADTDPRTAGHPAIGPWGVGAWAGFPIVTADGQPIGTMCVIDAKPRVWKPDELETLAILARAVSTEVNLRVSLELTRNALTTAQAALARSTDLVRSLQESLLPPVLPALPGLDIAARYLPAGGEAEIGGDFYDVFPARGPWWTAVLGDVCGKGTEAAKVTALARHTVRADIGEHLSPAAVLLRLNAAMLAQHTRRCITAVQTTFLVTAGGLTGRLSLAGHPPALLRRADGRVQWLGRYGSLLGVFEHIKLSDVRFRLTPGDLLLLYTDGACEASADPHGPEPDRIFDSQALLHTLAGSRDLDAAATVAHIADALAAHHGGAADDDTALLAIRVPPRT